MNKFTEVKQKLGKAIWELIKIYGDKLTVNLTINNVRFYARHYGADEKYVVEMGWLFADNGNGLMAVRKTFRGPEDAVSDRTKVEDMELALTYMPVVEKLLEVEADHNRIGEDNALDA